MLRLIDLWQWQYKLKYGLVFSVCPGSTTRKYRVCAWVVGLPCKVKARFKRRETSLRLPRSLRSFFVAVAGILVGAIEVFYLSRLINSGSAGAPQMGCRVPQVALVLTSCSTRTQLRAAIMWFAAQTYHMLALLRWAGVQGVKWCPVV